MKIRLTGPGEPLGTTRCSSYVSSLPLPPLKIEALLLPSRGLVEVPEDAVKVPPTAEDMCADAHLACTPLLAQRRVEGRMGGRCAGSGPPFPPLSSREPDVGEQGPLGC